MASQTIELNMDRREIVRGLVQDSQITCTATSHPDVYVNVITPARTSSLHLGDDTTEARLTRVRLHLFRVSSSDEPFSATIVINGIPAAAASLSAPGGGSAKKKKKRKAPAAKKKRKAPAAKKKRKAPAAKKKSKSKRKTRR